jgi:hypothetical protein
MTDEQHTPGGGPVDRPADPAAGEDRAGGAADANDSADGADGSDSADSADSTTAAGRRDGGDRAGEQQGRRGVRELSSRERAVLGTEQRSWPGPGAKERAIRERLGMSPVRYYQLLNALLDDESALAHDPVTVNRLRRVRDERRARR